MQATARFELHAQHQPDAEFARDSTTKSPPRSLSYGQANEGANQIAHAMIATGLKPGDRVAVIMKNSIETGLLYLAAFKAGVVPVPISPRLMPMQWCEICNDADAKLMICDSVSAQILDSDHGRLPSSLQRIVVGQPPSGWVTFDDWIASQPTEAVDVPLTDDAELLQIYTSGTTGKPRGVVWTHRAVDACVAQLQQVARFQRSDRFLLVMPLFHAAGIMVMLHAVAGGASILIHADFDSASVSEALGSQHVTVTMLAPTMIHKLLHEVADIGDQNFEDLRLIIYGASPIKEETLRRAMEVFRCDFAQRYGSTETLCLSWLNPADHTAGLEAKPQLLHSAGRPLPGVKIKVIDSQGQELPPRERGQLIASGPQLMKGYCDAEQTTELVIDGQRWLRTGDCGFVNEDRYIFICERADDVIISGGENIYPQEIENVLHQHPSISEATVIGVPDQQWGEAVKAVVVCAASVSEAELLDFCRDHLPGFQVPRSVAFVEALPRTAAGKLQRFKLREHFQSSR